VPVPAAAGSTTQEYRGEPAAGTATERVRVALVPEAGSVTDGDLYRFLRRRLRAFCTMLANLFFAMASLSLVFSLAGFHPDGRVDLTEWLRLYWKLLLLTISLSASAAVLWRRPPRTVGGLRIIELVVIGALAIYMLQLNALPFAWDFLVEAGQQQSPRGRMAYRTCYTMMVALQWFFILTVYGTFIPNTWRRCAAVVAVIAASPLVLFVVQGVWFRPLDRTIFWIGLLQIGFFVTFAAVIAIVACSRIEILRRQVGEARKLGQYVLKEKLGEGGMGEVYLAQHVLLRRPCALKLIRPERAGDQKVLRRFEREVQATATLTHPNTRWNGSRHARLSVAGTGRRTGGGRGAQRHLQRRGAGVLPALGAPPIRRPHGHETDCRAPVRGAGAVVPPPGRRAGRPGGRDPSLSGQGPECSVSRRQQPGCRTVFVCGGWANGLRGRRREGCERQPSRERWRRSMLSGPKQALHLTWPASALWGVHSLPGGPGKGVLRNFYQGKKPSVDLDDISKPIFDSMEGIVYRNDRQIKQAQITHLRIGGAFSIAGVSRILVTALQTGSQFVYVRIEGPADPFPLPK
jgi:hypothetical protein